MNKGGKIKLTLILLIMLGMYDGDVRAQLIDDFESWHNVGIAYPVNSGLSVSAKYIFGNYNNISSFKRSSFSLQADQKINKWLKLGAEYRYNTSYDGDFNRFWLYAVAEQKLFRKTELQFRTLLQYDIDNFNRAYFEAFPPHAVTRNMLRLKYKASKRTSLYCYADIYHSWKNSIPKAYRMRYGIGISYLYKKRHDLGAELVMIDEFNRRAVWDVGFMNLKYVYMIRHKKKKEHTPEIIN